MKSAFVAMIVLGSILFVSSASAREDFYVDADLGWAKTYYGGNSTLQNFVASQQPNLSAHVPLAFDAAIMMKFLGKKTLAGAGLDNVFDYYFQNGTTTNGAFQSTSSGAIYQIAPVLTIRHYFGATAGTGPYFRGDLGGVWVHSNSNIYSSSSAANYSGGFFALGGVGFGLRLSPHAILHVEGDYSRSILSQGSIGIFQPLLGVTAQL